MLHWLILIPYYFFLAICLSLLFVVLARLLRAGLSASHLITTAVLLAMAGVALPLAFGWARIGDYSASGFLLLAAASLVLAFIDTLLRSVLPLPLDRDLEAL